MYHGKRIGGDRIEVFKPAMRTRKSDRLTLETDLRRSLERDEMTVLYQPVVWLEDRSVAGFEALLRWDHPKMGRLSPTEFIPLAEETGFIVELGLFVLDRATRQLALWQRATRLRYPLFVQRQHLVAPAAAPRPDPGSAHRAVALRGRARHAQARADRVAGDGEPRIRRADAHAHARARRRPLARRFRHRPFLARLSAALPVRHHQDRPVVRARQRQGRAAGDPALDHRAGARSLDGRDRRGRRARRRRDRALSARLRIRAGLSCSASRCRRSRRSRWSADAERVAPAPRRDEPAARRSRVADQK